MRRLLLPIITALLTFFGSVTFTQIWERSSTRTAQPTISIFAHRTLTAADVTVRLAAAEEEYWRCLTPRTLGKTKAERERKRHLCFQEWIKANRIILEEESMRYHRWYRSKSYLSPALSEGDS